MKKKLQLLNIFFLSDQRLNRVPMLASVRKGLTYMIPLLLLGSFALLILSLPIPAYQNFMSDIFGKEWGGAFLYVRDATFNILSIFMVICISYSYINDLGNWIFAKACSDLKQLQESGHQQITMAINISAAQLESDDFIPVLKEIIKSNRISSDFIKIEITEQIALAGSKKIIDHMNGIKEMGIKLAMDDFGMGHSSLKYLKEYEFDTIKLDGCLVREVASNANCRSIISSIVFLGESMNCSIIAEYVETELILIRLNKKGFAP